MHLCDEEATYPGDGDKPFRRYGEYNLRTDRSLVRWSRHGGTQYIRLVKSCVVDVGSLEKGSRAYFTTIYRSCISARQRLASRAGILKFREYHRYELAKE